MAFIPYLNYAMAGINIVKGIKEIFTSNSKNDKNERLERVLREREEEFKRRENKIQNEMENLRQMLADQKRMGEENNRRELERQQRELEKEQQKLKEQKEAMLKCQNDLSKKYLSCLMDIFKNFEKEESKIFLELNKEITPLLNDFKNFIIPSMFKEIYTSENISNKLNKIFLKIVKESFQEKKLTKMTFMLIGSSGVGKSTLINELYDEQKAEVKNGERCTLVTTIYHSEKIPFFDLVDTRGTEKNEDFQLRDVMKETIDFISKKLDDSNSDPNQHIHCVIYCLTSNRFFEDEMKIIQKIREKYDGKRLPIIIVYTRANNDEEVKGVRNSIEKYLEKFKEKIGDGIFDISFIEVYAKEREYEKYGEKRLDPCSGLSNLLEACFKKGKISYKVAIENSLVEITKNILNNYVNNIAENLLKKNELRFYVSEKFEPNFRDFIAYVFDKITNFENYINNNKLNGIQYGKLKITNEEINKINNNIEYNNKINNNNENNNEDLLEKYKCTFHGGEPIIPYKCDGCGRFACEDCYLKRFEEDDDVTCTICGLKGSYVRDEDADFFIRDCFYSQDNNKDNINIINEEKVDDFNNFNLIKDDNVIDNQNKKIYENILLLDNKLNYNSKTIIKNNLETLTASLIPYMDEKFNELVKKKSNEVYYQMLEKFNEISREQDKNININEAMKDKNKLQNETQNELKNQLYESTKENFLNQISQNLYNDIIENFKNFMLNRIKEYIQNISNNQELKNIFKEFGLNNNKEIELEEDFNKYIQKLKEREVNSMNKSLKYVFGDQSNIPESVGESGGCSYFYKSSSGNCGTPRGETY